MKVIGWTEWDDPRYREEYLGDPLSEEHRNAVIDELRKKKTGLHVILLWVAGSRYLLVSQMI